MTMQITSPSFSPGERIPDRYTFARPDEAEHFTLSDNRNPAFQWTGVPDGAKSLVLLCVDTDVPSVGDDVNQEGRSVPEDLARTDFHHWVMVDIAPTCTGIEEGACSDGVTVGGKDSPPGPSESRQGLNDFTKWFDGHPQMSGAHWGYDGPAPPWNDERLHHYRFRLYALDIDRCPVDGAFTGPDVEKAIEGHVLDQCEYVGTYTMNPTLMASRT